MNKADQLGAGRFGGGARPVSARRSAIGAATGVPTEGVPAPNKLPVDRISLNPDNPRSELGDLTELAGSLRDHGQKQAITVMNRDAYVKAHPSKEAELEPNATHVVVDGSCRLAAAREAGLTTLKVMVDDEQGTNADDLLESALVANIHRQDLEPLDEAHALERLLRIHGSQTALAARLHRSQGWVSQRLALLNLSPELQERIGHEPIDLLRAVGNKPAEAQKGALEELKVRRARKDADKAQARKAAAAKQPTPSPESPVKADQHDADAEEFYGRKTAPDTPAASELFLAQEEQAATPPANGSGEATASVPVQATIAVARAGGDQQPQRFPYEDGVYAAQHLIHKMPPGEFNKMLGLLIKHRDSQGVRAG